MIIATGKENRPHFRYPPRSISASPLFAASQWLGADWPELAVTIRPCGPDYVLLLREGLDRVLRRRTPTAGIMEELFPFIVCLVETKADVMADVDAVDRQCVLESLVVSYHCFHLHDKETLPVLAADFKRFFLYELTHIHSGDGGAEPRVKMMTWRSEDSPDGRARFAALVRARVAAVARSVRAAMIAKMRGAVVGRAYGITGYRVIRLKGYRFYRAKGFSTSSLMCGT